MSDDFCVFILTHGRPDNIKTLKALERGNYTGKVYIVIDNEDDKEDEYRRLYGDKVVQFDKLEISKSIDSHDNFGKRTAILYARHACYNIANDLGIRYFVQLDDDYTAFMFRHIDGKKLGMTACENLDSVFESMVKFLVASGAMTVAFAQGGDFIGGAQSERFKKGILRKAMNSFFCRTDMPIDFRGTMNEDVTTYTTLGSRGKLFFTVTNVMICQEATQGSAGGMSEFYKETGTYFKTFYSIMSHPSSIKVAQIGTTSKRIHHRIDWRHTVPQIMSERVKK